MHPAPIGRSRRLRPDTVAMPNNTARIVASVAELIQKRTAAESVRGKTRLTKPRRSRGRFAGRSLTRALEQMLRDVSVASFQARCCKDFTRVDIRIGAGAPYVLETGLGSGASFVLAAKAAGYNFSQLVNRIVDVAHRRYFFPMQTPMHASGISRTLKARQSCTARKAWWLHRSKLEKRSVLIPCGNALVC